MIYNVLKPLGMRILEHFFKESFQPFLGSYVFFACLQTPSSTTLLYPSTAYE